MSKAWVKSNMKRNTKYEILQYATKLFVEKGYTSTYVTNIANELNISTGNLTFHFPTKEHILAELIKELLDLPKWEEENLFQGEHALLSGYLFELAMFASVCRDNPNIKDLIVSAYTRPMSLQVIREADTKRAMEIFGKYCPGWKETDYVQTENVVSGMEYAMFMTENTDLLTFEQRIYGSMDAIMKVYEIPKDIRDSLLTKIMKLDYSSMGNQVFDEFCNYIATKM